MGNILFLVPANICGLMMCSRVTVSTLKPVEAVGALVDIDGKKLFKKYIIYIFNIAELIKRHTLLVKDMKIRCIMRVLFSISK